jgi:hypothetical protein
MNSAEKAAWSGSKAVDHLTKSIINVGNPPEKTPMTKAL